MAEKLRVKLYGHIQDLDYEFHNNADTGDLIQRCTTDVETTTTFLTTRMLDFIYFFLLPYFFGAFQLYFINPTMVWISLSLIPLGCNIINYLLYKN